MNSVTIKIAAVLLFLLSLPLTVGSASAHRVNVFAWVEGDTVHVESKFAGGKKVKAGKIIVMDSKGNELLSGRTNDQGEYSFVIPIIPTQTDLRIVLIAGQGHRGEWTIRATEMQQPPSGTEPDDPVENITQSENNHTVFEISEETKPSTADNRVNMTELEAVIESVLDRKLKPITKMLADAQHKETTAKDIFGGIGYILGLVGIAAYVHSRKKKGD